MNSTSSRRTQRVARLLRSEISRLVFEEISDPPLKEVVITDVQVTGDLKLAKVYYERALGTRVPKEVERAFHRAAPFLRRRLGDNLDLRYVPELQFLSDTHTESVVRIHQLLDEVKSTKG